MVQQKIDSTAKPSILTLRFPTPQSQRMRNRTFAIGPRLLYSASVLKKSIFNRLGDNQDQSMID